MHQLVLDMGGEARHKLIYIIYMIRLELPHSRNDSFRFTRLSVELQKYRSVMPKICCISFCLFHFFLITLSLHAPMKSRGHPAVLNLMAHRIVLHNKNYPLCKGNVQLTISHWTDNDKKKNKLHVEML